MLEGIASSAPSYVLAIRPGNGYAFHCPTVDRDVRYMACQFMRHRHWRGDTIPQQDCACAMRGSKCPAVEMIKIEDRGDATFFDSEPTMHRLPKEVVERIAPILLLPSHANGADLTPEQKHNLFGRRDIKLDQAAAADTAAPAKAPRTRTTAAAKPRASTKSEDLTDGLAAIQHDKSTQINQAMKASIDET